MGFVALRPGDACALAIINEVGLLGGIVEAPYERAWHRVAENGATPRARRRAAGAAPDIQHKRQQTRRVVGSAGQSQRCTLNRGAPRSACRDFHGT